MLECDHDTDKFEPLDGRFVMGCKIVEYHPNTVVVEDCHDIFCWI